MGLRCGGREREDEQTVQGSGEEGWSKHMAFGTALEQPVPKKIKEEEMKTEEELLLLLLIGLLMLEEAEEILEIASASASERILE